jgi:hypothetical protein
MGFSGYSETLGIGPETPEIGLETPRIELNPLGR